MRLLLFSDLHCDHHAARQIVVESTQADVVVGAGDFATMRRGLQPVIDVLTEITVPCILVPGNSESFEELTQACKGWASARVLHGTGTTVDGVPFWGLGGAVPVTPFGAWSYDFSEQQAEALLADCPTRSVLVSHSPPKGLLDCSSQGRSLGSQAVRAAIDTFLPRLVVCGHIHDSSGQSVDCGPTRVVNAGPAGMWEQLDG